MITPKFLKKSGTIGVVAPSDGFSDGKYKDASIKASKRLESLGYKLIYSKSCFNSIDGRSNDAKTRAKEFIKMYFDENIDILLSISGGDYEIEILDYLPLRKMKKYPKLFCGYSDNSVLTFILLTNCDTVSIYGHNLYELAHNHEVIDNYLEALKGKLLPQVEIKDVSKEDYDHSDKKINEKYKIDYKCKWKLVNSNSIDTDGILIGGLLDNLKDIVGTKYDKVNTFIKKYKKHGFIWYFDICLMSKDEVMESLLKLKNAGWFEYAKAIMIGRPLLFDNYEIFSVLKDFDIPIILDINISHIPPSYHMVNGKKVRVSNINGTFKIEYLKED